MERRCAGVFVTLILLFMAMVLRIFVLSRSAYYAAVAGGQSSWLLGVDQSRGQIYDCNLKPLTGSETRYVAAVEPSAEAAGALYPVLAEEDREAATHALAGLTPFVIDVTSPEVYAPGVEVFEVQDRVSAGQTAVHLIGYLPLYVAIHEGYFADEGLDVTVVQATGGAHVTAVVSGDAFAVIGGVDSNNFANQGNADPIVAIVNCVNRANVYLFARAGLSPASDSDEDMADFLRGKIIIAGRYGGSPNVLTRYLVKRVGLDPDTDVTLLENADAATVTAMLQYGQGDIGNGGEPQISEGVTAGIFEEPFVAFPDLGDYAYSVIGVKRSTMEQQPETCLRFVRAMMKALKAVQDDHELAARVLELEFPTLTEAGRQAALERAYADNLWSADGIISRQAVDTLMEVVTSSGMFDGTYDVDELIDMRFVEQVMQESAQE